MPRLRSVATLAAFVVAPLAPAVALGLTVPIEGLTPGPAAGQDGFHVVFGDGAGFTIDDTLFSPSDGSTQSLRIRGNPNGGPTGDRIARALSETFNSGLYRVGYDIYISPREPGSPTNLVARTVLYTPGEANQLLQPYVQDGGNDLPAQNGFADRDGLGPGPYEGVGLVTGFTYPPNTWHRFEFDADFDAHTASNFRIFNISSGTPQEVASNTAETFFFRNDGSSFFEPFGSLGFGLDVARPSEGFNVDNFSIAPVPEPGVCTIAAAAFAVGWTWRRRPGRARLLPSRG